MKPALLLTLIVSFAYNSSAQTPRKFNSHRTPRAHKVSSNSHHDNQAGVRQLQQLPIRRVILYSNGVAYIERRGVVSGSAEVSLSFKQSQVDDVLKSMVVLDLGKGRIGAVSYNSSAPASARLAEIPFAISASTDGNNGGGLAGVLMQLQGSRVVVMTANLVVSGSLLTVEVRHSQIDATKPAETTHRLVIASENGELSGFDLADVRSVQLLDQDARRDVSEFAHAAASARRRDAKTIVVTSEGLGEREMIVSYTIAAPIWKTTYRVVLDSSGKPFFQGWAIVDNISEEDWSNIRLSLVSGTPVSFIQPLQNPVYRYRPIVPLSSELSLRPQTYEPSLGNAGGTMGSLTGTIEDSNGARVPNAKVVITNEVTKQSFDVTTDDEGEFEAHELPSGRYKLTATAAGFQQHIVTDLNVVPGLKSEFNVTMQPGTISQAVTVTAAPQNNYSVDGLGLNNLLSLRPGTGTGRGVSASELIASRQAGVETETTASEIGDLFEYRIDQPVTVPRDRSALIPILQTKMEGVRVSIFNAAAGTQNRPMSGMLLRNSSPLTLEDGSLTVVDGDAYAGEALMARLKPGEERLISFALDLGTLINIRDEEKDQPVFLVQAANGYVEAHYYRVRKRVYTLINQTDRERVVYIEHPVDSSQDWALSDDTTKPTAVTASYYRFRVELKPRQRLEFPVAERTRDHYSFALSNFTRDQLTLFVAGKYVDEISRRELERIIGLRDQIAAIETRLAQMTKESEEIARDQQRLRENIKALTATTEAKALIARYVSKANEQETRLEQIEKERAIATNERARLQAELASSIRKFSLDRELK